MKITIIGGGMMGQALIQGLINLPQIQSDNIFLLSGHQETTQKVANKFGINEIKSIDDLPEVDLLINATPVNVSKSILHRISKNVPSETVLISVAYGLDLTQLQQIVGQKENLIYMIPNLPVAVNSGVLAVDYPDKFNFETSAVKEILEGLGIIVTVKNELIDVLSAGAGSAPAFVAMMIEALADGMVLHGVGREMAYEIVEKMVFGTAKMMLDQGILPAELKDQVASPGGSTIRGIATLEEYQMRNALIKVISSTINTPK